MCVCVRERDRETKRWCVNKRERSHTHPHTHTRTHTHTQTQTERERERETSSASRPPLMRGRRLPDFAFRIQFRVEEFSSGFRDSVQGVGILLRLSGSGFRVWGLEFGV